MLKYHQGPTSLAVDLGCGHGAVTRTLSSNFQKVIGTDPSSRMISQAQSTTTESNVTFRSGMAEELDFLDDGSIDFVCAAQAAHWFDYSKVWPVLHRKLRQGGTVAFWGYKDNYFVDFPEATKVLDHYCYTLGVGLMGEFWEQPGRNILRDKLRAIVPPTEQFDQLERIEYEPDVKGKASGVGQVLMARDFKLGEMEGYARTFSAYVNWMEANPGKRARKDGGNGDVIDDMFDEMLKVEPEWRKEGENWREKVVASEWGSAIVMARKK